LSGVSSGRLLRAPVRGRHRYRAAEGGDQRLHILVLFVFVAAVMESVAARLLATPMITIGLAVLAFVVFFAVLCLTTLVFASAGLERALTVGFMASQRNVGLMLAASGGALPDLTWLYFAFSYFPIYVSPLLLQPLTRRMIARASDAIDPRGPKGK